MLRVLIAEGDLAHCARLRELLAGRSDAALVGECDDGLAALEMIERDRPDVVLLDTDLPGMDGFAVWRVVQARYQPAVVFLGTDERRAIQAFDVNATDFLLKPVKASRLARAIARCEQHRPRPPEHVVRKLDRLLARLEIAPQYLENLVIRTGHKIKVVPVAEVDLFTADSNYVRVQSGAQTYVLRDTLGSLYAQLDPRHFVRIHRSYIVRIGYISHLESVIKGEYLVVLRSGQKLSSGPSFRDEVERALGMA